MSLSKSEESYVKIPVKCSEDSKAKRIAKAEIRSF